MPCFCAAPLNDNVVTTTCGHNFHDACIRQWINTRHNYCPTCRANITIAGLRRNYMTEIDDANNGIFHLKVSTLNGKKFLLDGINEGTRIDLLQNEVYNKTGILPQFQTLLFKGTMLENGRNLSDYGIRSGDTIQLVHRQVGGA